MALNAAGPSRRSVAAPRLPGGRTSRPPKPRGARRASWTAEDAALPSFELIAAFACVYVISRGSTGLTSTCGRFHAALLMAGTPLPARWGLLYGWILLRRRGGPATPPREWWGAAVLRDALLPRRQRRRSPGRKRASPPPSPRCSWRRFPSGSWIVQWRRPGEPSLGLGPRGVRGIHRRRAPRRDARTRGRIDPAGAAVLVVGPLSCGTARSSRVDSRNPASHLQSGAMQMWPAAWPVRRGVRTE